MELVPTKEPASHLASRRSTGSLPNASNRAEAHTHYFVTKSAARVTPCGRGHSTLRSFAPQYQTKPASLGFCLVEGNERYGGKYAKKQAIQYKNLRTGLGNDTQKSGASAHEPERLCDRVLSRKTDCDSGRTERSPAAAKSHRKQPQPADGTGEHGESPVRQSGFCRANSV